MVARAEADGPGAGRPWRALAGLPNWGRASTPRSFISPAVASTTIIMFEIVRMIKNTAPHPGTGPLVL